MAILIDENAFYTRSELADTLGLKVTTLEARDSRGTGFPFIKNGGQVLYSGRAILAHLHANERPHGAAHKAAKLANSSAARQAVALANSPAVQAACRTADAVAPRRGRRAR